MKRWLIFSVGIVSLGLGIVGAFLPILPTTPFILLTAWCFLKSSPKAHSWLKGQPIFGKLIDDWETNGAITRRSKIVALVTMVISVALVWIRVDVNWIRIVVSLIMMGAMAFIITRPES